MASTELPQNDSYKVEIEATVVAGLESMAREEIREKLNVQAEMSRGRAWFHLEAGRVDEIFRLQSIDNFFAVVERIPEADFRGDKTNDLTYLNQLVTKINWQKGVTAWRKVRAPQRSIEELFSQKDLSADEVSPEGVEKLPKFRVTCNRSGEHKFTSMQAAANFGAGVNDTFHWKVAMKGFDMNIVINILANRVDIFLALTTASLHHRNLIDFGPTSLRSTIAYNMLRLCRIKPGDIVVDPLCGGGSIPIEAAKNFPSSFVLCADNHELAIPRCKKNLEHNKAESHRTDLLQWDSTRMPLRVASVDVLVTDLPFGKRMGCKSDNRVLYPALLKEMARVASPGSARAVLLTQDKRSLIQAIVQCSQWWKQGYTVACNVGGLDTVIIVCHRTAVPYSLD